jgi:hypothetical protein
MTPFAVARRTKDRTKVPGKGSLSECSPQWVVPIVGSMPAFRTQNMGEEATGFDAPTLLGMAGFEATREGSA